MHPKNLYQKRIKQNLQNIDLDDDSEDEYIPDEEDEDEALLIEETDDFLPKKRKRNTVEVPVPNKKTKGLFDCEECAKTFSRKDSLNRHRKNYCKSK